MCGVCVCVFVYLERVSDGEGGDGALPEHEGAQTLFHVPCFLRGLHRCALQPTLVKLLSKQGFSVSQFHLLLTLKTYSSISFYSLPCIGHLSLLLVINQINEVRPDWEPPVYLLWVRSALFVKPRFSLLVTLFHFSKARASFSRCSQACVRLNFASSSSSRSLIVCILCYHFNS